MTDQIHVRQANDTDRDLLIQLRELGMGDGNTWSHKIEQDPRYSYKNYVLAEQAGQAVGCSCMFSNQMWLSGVPIEMGAVTDVTVHPDYQDKGVFEAVMQHLLEAMHARGIAISVKFPTAYAPYRSLGYESAAVWHVYRLTPDQLFSFGEAKHVRPFTEDDLPAIRSVYRGNQLSQADGRLMRSAALWDQIVAEKYRRGKNFIIVYDNDAIEGYAKCRIIQNSALQIVEMFFSSDEAYRGLWGYFADKPDITRIHCLSPADAPLLHTMHATVDKGDLNQTATTFHDVYYATTSFMLRVINITEALTSRFYPHNMMGNRIIKINDPQLPANTELINFRIVNGRPDTLSVDGREPDIETDIATFSQIFCGFLKPETARLLGKLEAKDETILWLSQAMETNPLYIHQGDWF